MFFDRQRTEQRYMEFMLDFASNPTMRAIRNGLLLALPLLMAGSIAILLNNLPIPAYQETMQTIFGESWRDLGGNVWRGTFGILAIIMLISISSHLVIRYNIEHPLKPVSPVIATLISLAALVILMPEIEGGIFLQEFTASAGLFVSITVALIATKLFLKLMNVPQLKISLHAEGADTAIPQAFSALLPGICVLFVFGFLKIFLLYQGIDSLYALIRAAILYPFNALDSTLESGAIYISSIQFLWFFGIHGPNVLDPITHEFYEMAASQNLAAIAAGQPIPHIVNKLFFDVFVSMGGSGSAICLLFALFVASKNSSSLKLAQISIAPAIFNINEMLLFGLPVILNPVFLIPFVLVPLILSFNSYLFFYLGLVPPPIHEAAWTTPPLIGGYIVTGSIKGSLLQCLNLVIGTLCYIPFVRFSDRIKAESFKIAMSGLFDAAVGNASGATTKKVLDRDDEVGVLARELANDLENALARNTGLFLEYQPQIDDRTGKVTGVEALVRWNHPNFGLIAPPITVAISEDGDFIDRLGLWVFNEAVRERKCWLDKGIDDIQMSINLSVRQLEDRLLPQKLMQIIHKHDVPISLIELEVTESVALNHDTQDNIILQRLHEMGFKIAIDDFGAGHSSLLYLKHFPVSTLKLDKVLSKDVVHNKASYEIITTIVELCKAMDVDIVTEFVEDELQIEILRKLGCYIFQGYYFSRPIKGDDCLAYIRKMNKLVKQDTSD